MHFDAFSKSNFGLFGTQEYLAGQYGGKHRDGIAAFILSQDCRNLWLVVERQGGSGPVEKGG